MYSLEICFDICSLMKYLSTFNYYIWKKQTNINKNVFIHINKKLFNLNITMFYGLTTKRIAFLYYSLCNYFREIVRRLSNRFREICSMSKLFTTKDLFFFSLHGKLTRGLAFWTLFPAIQVRFRCSFNTCHSYSTLVEQKWTCCPLKQTYGKALSAVAF